MNDVTSWKILYLLNLYQVGMLHNLRTDAYYLLNAALHTEVGYFLVEHVERSPVW